MPLLHTVGFVVEKLQNGSPLMTPGLAKGPPFPKKATANAVVAIASIENPSVPKVVGICEIDVSSLTQVQGVKGHAVRSEHWEGDELWAWSSSGAVSGSAAPSEIEDWLRQDTDASLSQGLKLVELEEHDEDDAGGVALDSKAEVQQQIEPRNEHVEGEDAEPAEKLEEDLSTKGEPTCIRHRGRSLNLQKLTTHFGKRSFMLFTTTAKQGKAKSIAGFRFLFPRLLSCQIWCSHTYQ